MKDQSNAPQIFAFALIALIFAIYFVSLQLRRGRYKRIAEGLGAEYRSQGLLRTGEVAGSSNGRHYNIRTRERRRSTWTTFSVDCRNRGLRLSLHGRFFRPFPNWKFAFAKAEVMRKAFAVALDYPYASMRLEDKCRGQVESLLQEVAALGSNLLGKWRNHLDVGRDTVSFTMHGVLSNVATTREIIWLLAGVASRVEFQPVV